MYNRKITTQVSMDKNGMFEIYEIDETEYQKQPTMEDKTLNERIFNVIESFVDWNKEKDTVLGYDADGAANEIEKLILSEIEKAFDAGVKLYKWIYNADCIIPPPNKEQYIKSIKKEPQ